MIYRTLLDPAPVDGNGNPAPAPTQPNPVPAPAPAPTPPVGVAIPADELARLYSISRQFSELQAERQKAVEAEQQKSAIALAQKGEVETAFKQYTETHTAKYAALQTSWLNDKVDLAVSAALAGKTFTSDFARDQARILLANRIEAVLGQDGKPIVRDKVAGRPAPDVLNEALAGPEFAHFLAPQTKGGAGSGNTSGTNPGANPNAPPPGSFQEHVSQWKAAQQEAQQNLMGGFGLQRVSRN